MIIGERLADRIRASGLTYAEVAERTGVKQPTISRLVSGEQAGTTRIDKLARVVRSTPAYLTGETDDPDSSAPLPPEEPRLQLVTMPVALPTEDALADGFEAVLSVSREMSEGELARELAKRLPSLLRIAGGAAAVQPRATRPAADEVSATPAADRRVRRRA